MVRERRSRVMELLRQQILRGLQTGALGVGTRLPSVRQVGSELGVDPRVVALAYGDLAAQGLVEVRERSGAFIASLPNGSSAQSDPSSAWLADTVAEGVLRGIAAPNAAQWLQRAVVSRVVSAAVLVGILDQADGLARELRAHFGIAAAAVLLDALRPGEPLPRALRRAHFLVTTPGNATQVRKIAQQLGKAFVVADARPGLLGLEWQFLMRRTVYVVVADPRFQQIVREFVSTTEEAANVHLLVAGKDDIAAIPPDAPTYVTESARICLGRTRLPGRLIPPVRIMSDASVREVARLLVELNLAASSTGRSRRDGRRPSTDR